MDLRRLYLLLELSRLGSMRAVAETHGLTTSTVSQQIAALSREVKAQLIEPVGRRVRLTPAGHRLADHAVTILAAVDAALLDLDAGAEPSGTVRVGGFATAIRSSLLPVVEQLAESHPGVRVAVQEYEPLEAFELLADDRLDLLLTYDYNLVPAVTPATVRAHPLWSTPWGLAVPASGRPAARTTARPPGRSPADFARWGREPWIVNSRNTADEEAVRTLGGLYGFTPRIVHSIDSLDLVEDLILAGYGVGLLPLDRPTRAGVVVHPIAEPPLVLTAYAVTRRGREDWPPLRAVLDGLVAQSRSGASSGASGRA